MDDEDLDLSVQLAAWAAPPAPHNLADRVIARATATDEAIAVVTQRRRTQRRLWLAGGLAALFAGAAIALVAVPRHTIPGGASAGSGTAVATRPQQLSLPGAIANLDPGTDVVWQTSGGAIHVQQRSGAATWRVDKPELFLEVGAAVASIEASNATLRVETRMNFSDTRVIGAAALTSAAVALVTVAVYEGHVKLSGAGQTVVVQPGMTYEVLPGQAPIRQIDKVDRALDEVEHTVAGTPKVTPPAVSLSAVDELVVPIGESITIHNAGAPVRIRVDTKCPTDNTPFYPEGGAGGAVGPGDYSFSFTCNGIDKHGRIRVVQDVTIGSLYSPAEGASWGDTVEVDGMPVAERAQVSIEGVPIPTAPKAPWHALVKAPAGRSFIAVRVDGGVDEIDYYIRHAASAERTAQRPREDRAALTADELERVMKPLAPTLAPCVKKWPSGQDVAVSIAADGHVTDILTSDSDRNTDACLRKVLRNAAFPKTKVSSRLTYHVDAPCNADDLLNEGIQGTARGDSAGSLKSYEASLACKFDVHTLTLTFMAACRAGDINAARRHWRQLTADQKTHYLQMCLHEHITQQQLDE